MNKPNPAMLNTSLTNEALAHITAIFAHAQEVEKAVKVKRTDPIDYVTIEIERDGDCFDVDVEILSYYEGSQPYHSDGSRFAYDDDPADVELGEAYTTNKAQATVILTQEEEQEARDKYIEEVA